MARKNLIIQKLSVSVPTIEKVSAILDKESSKAEIATINWKEFPYLPKVSFAMGYDTNHLFLKYYIQEEHIRAMETKTNGNVWEDSCCEFFCAFDEQGYYNMETNCIGTQLVGWGKTKTERELLPETIIHSVLKLSTLGNEAIDACSGNYSYELTMIIPASTYLQHPQLRFKPGMSFKANFYKCGDKTPHPHFVSWSPIKIDEPNFHRPDFFGTIILG